MDLTYLKETHCFQQLPPYQPPEPFNIDHQTVEAYNLEELIQKRLYIPAAHRAREQLIKCASDDVKSIFDLWGKRLSCLLLARLNIVAAEECRQFGDLGSDKYRGKEGYCNVPWDFRLLIVPIQAGRDTQSALGRYYTMAREARVESANARNSNLDQSMRESGDIWDQRLRELALYVASTLINGGDIASAIHHLTSVFATADAGTEKDKIFAKTVAFVLAMAYAKVGDTSSARIWFEKSDKDNALFVALCLITDAQWTQAIKLLENNKTIEAQNNLALVQMHAGNMEGAIELLEGVAKDPQSSSYPSIFTTLFTMYDLHHEVSNESRAKTLAAVRESGVESLGVYGFMRSAQA